MVAKLVEWSLQMPEVRGLNPVIGNFFYQTFICLLSTVLKRRNKRNRLWQKEVQLQDLIRSFNGNW